MSGNFLVVGIGGSAGSITSFREFLRNVPPDSGMAYVVILHLAPEHESRLAEVLQTSTPIPVQQVRESVRVQPDNVYVIGPNKSLTMVDGMLVLSDQRSFEERRAPIDIFFRTLADTHDSRAVCVVMSGSGTDGSMGLRRIKEYNGLVLVQDPTEAAFSEMPRSCLATGLVDFVVPAAEMPARILTYRDQVRTVHIADETEQRTEDDEQSLMEVFSLLRLRTGHDFTNYKRATVLRRIERRMAVRQLERLADYVSVMREEVEESHALLRELLISVTNFFRDGEVWEKVEHDLIPKIAARKRADDHVRVWIAGCATGEEAYSLAMLFAERVVPNVQIFATDLDEAAIARARNGWYSETEVADVAPDRLRRFFLREQDGYRVRREIRELILFAHHNLIKDPPFSHLDLISCRNVLIYLNRTAQQRAMEVLHFALEPGGYLLLGTAESVDSAPSLFSTVDKDAHLYLSRAVERVISVPPPIPVPSGSAVDMRALMSAPMPEARSFDRPRERFAPIDLHQRLLEQYAPPSLVVDEQYNLVHLSPRAGRYLQFSAGEASVNLLHVIRQELRIDVRSALFQASQKLTTVIVRALAVHTGEREEKVTVIVQPALHDGDPARGFFLVVFEESRDAESAPIHEATAVEPAARQLEEELIRVKSQMRATIEQYEVQAEEAKAANEELQAMNEELRSTAEELETSQEELQSVNEELQTVNQELKVKVDEITHASDDLRNLMSSTEIGTIFVDKSLRVKLFTPRVRDIFNLIPGDVGRPLLDLTNKLLIADLAESMGRVLDRLQTIEREVQTRDGLWFLMRMLPYRTSEDRIDGVVLTFHDITERHVAEEKARAGARADAFRVRLFDEIRPLTSAADIQRVAARIVAEELRVGRAMYAEVEDGDVVVTGEYTRGVPPLAPRVSIDDFGTAYRDIYTSGGILVIDDVAEDDRLSDDERATYAQFRVAAALAVPLMKGNRWAAAFSVHHSEPRHWTEAEVALLRDTAERTWQAIDRARAEHALREAEARYRTLFMSMDEGYAVVDLLRDAEGRWADFRFVEVNPAFELQTGMQDVAGRTATDILGEPNPRWAKTYGHVAETGEPARFEQYESTLGRLFDLYAFRLGGPGSTRVAVLFTNITERRRDERALLESESRLTAITNLVPDLLWMSDPEGVTTWYNERWYEYTGQRPEEASGWGWTEAIPPEDRELSRQRYAAAVAEARPLQYEQRIRGADGAYRWFLINARPLLDERDRVVRYYGAATEIHDQRMAREELERRVEERTRELVAVSANRRDLLERLVTVTEEERSRIARELHDEMGQHLTALKVGIEGLELDQEQHWKFTNLLTEIDRSVDRLALELRPAALDGVGLQGAILSLIDSFDGRSSTPKIDVQLNLDDERLPPAIESNLYRVVQEALTNVLRHAEATHVSIVLNRRADHALLVVEDNGRGFDSMNSVQSGTSLGLVGMRERLALIGGRLDVETESGKGTTIYACVPLVSRDVS